MAGADEPFERKRDRIRRVAMRAVPVPLSVRTSDLPKRAASAAVMMALTAGAVLAGGIVLDGFIVLVALICIGEFVRLVFRAAHLVSTRILGCLFGIAYIAYAAILLIQIDNIRLLSLIVGAVICVDTFAYFFGRAIGGPKIAPQISPSKTWAGLLGGVFGATLALIAYFMVAFGEWEFSMLALVLPAALIAVLAQAGDFFESWLKRKASMKDSSRLIPGHGGVFDRIDGLLPVVILVGTVVVQVYPHWLNH